MDLSISGEFFVMEKERESKIGKLGGWERLAERRGGVKIWIRILDFYKNVDEDSLVNG